MAYSDRALQSLPTRVVAYLASALVLALTILAASPELHERLHGHALAPPATAHSAGDRAGHPQAPVDEDGCVVTLFAQGLVLAVGLLAVASAERVVRVVGFSRGDWVAPGAPHFLLLPSQAPPVGLS